MVRRSTYWIAAAAIVGALCPGALPAADISGTVDIEDRKPLKHLVVYLEPALATNINKSSPATRVYQRGRAFSPPILVVVQGADVEFVNDEERAIDHNVYSLNAANRFDTGLVPKGGSRHVTFSAPGIVKYFCSVHKHMEGVIIVVPGPKFVVIDQPGKFTIKDVPPGRWRVNVAAAHRRYRAEPVKIEVSSEPVNNVLVRMRRKR